MTSGGLLFLKSGTYTIQSIIRVPNTNVSIEGENAESTILTAGPSNTNTVLSRTTAPTPGDLVLRNIKVIGRGVGVGNPVVDVSFGNESGTPTLLMEHVHIVNTSVGLALKADGNEGALLLHCFLQNAATAAGQPSVQWYTVGSGGGFNQFVACTING